jgi:hypothetical protein
MARTPGSLARTIARSCHAMTASRITSPAANVNGAFLMWSSGSR